MDKKRFEITYYTNDGNRRGQYETEERDLAIKQAQILKNELGYFPVVIYDNQLQDWVDF